MQEVLIIVHPDGYKTMKYDSHDSLGHEVIDYYTIKQLTEDQIKEIQNCTLDELQKILNHYI